MVEYSLFSAMGVEDIKKEEKKLAEKKSENKSSEGKSETKKVEIKKEMISGEIIVKVYGFEKFRVSLTEEKEKDLVLEDIRQSLVTDYDLAEFSKERTQMTYDKETGIVVPVISFQKKG